MNLQTQPLSPAHLRGGDERQPLVAQGDLQDIDPAHQQAQQGLR
ncbi:hypothetical protein [Arthrobacter psychrolactophilus]